MDEKNIVEVEFDEKKVISKENLIKAGVIAGCAAIAVTTVILIAKKAPGQELIELAETAVETVA